MARGNSEAGLNSGKRPARGGLPDYNSPAAGRLCVMPLDESFAIRACFVYVLVIGLVIAGTGGVSAKL